MPPRMMLRVVLMNVAVVFLESFNECFQLGLSMLPRRIRRNRDAPNKEALVQPVAYFADGEEAFMPALA